MAQGPHRRGSLKLVLIAVAGLPACSPSPDDVPMQLVRDRYASLEDCVADWNSEQECEAQAAPPTDPAAPASGANRGGGGLRIWRPYWYGPYHSSTGVVYDYDGRVRSWLRAPIRAEGADTFTRSINGVYAERGGRYAATAAHTDAVHAKATGGRGGFGGFGRSSGGG